MGKIIRQIELHQLRPRRIAIIKPSALGDVLNALPVLTALRQLYPSAHIAWVVNRSYEPLLKGHPDLSDILGFDRSMRRWWTSSYRFLKFLGQLRQQTFDLVIDLQCLFRSGLMTWATGAPVRIGLSSAREGAGRFYTHRIADNRRTQHAVDRYWQVIQELGGGHLPKEFRLAVDDDAAAWANVLLAGHPRPWMVLAVGSRWLTKRWPPQHFAALARQAQEQFGGTAIFIGAADEASLAKQTAAGLIGPVVDVTGATKLAQAVALLAQADVVLSNDSGPLHLAVALDRPVVAPYTCTQVRRNGPYGQRQRAVETTVWCRGSYRRTCSRLECMSELTPSKLWPILHEVLWTWQRRCA